VRPPERLIEVTDLGETQFAGILTAPLLLQVLRIPPEHRLPEGCVAGRFDVELQFFAALRTLP
jgi:hypothetical protein